MSNTFHYSRESLLADWQAIRPSNPLSDTLQDLFLEIFNAPTPSHVPELYQDEAASNREQFVNSVAPPPQRYQRQRRVSDRPNSVPNGPSVDFDVQKMFRASDERLDAPAGPDDTTDEVDLVFAAVDGK
jgi:hypothetical protein